MTGVSRWVVLASGHRLSGGRCLQEVGMVTVVCMSYTLSRRGITAVLGSYTTRPKAFDLGLHRCKLLLLKTDIITQV